MPDSGLRQSPPAASPTSPLRPGPMVRRETRFDSFVHRSSTARPPRPCRTTPSVSMSRCAAPVSTPPTAGTSSAAVPKGCPLRGRVAITSSSSALQRHRPRASGLLAPAACELRAAPCPHFAADPNPAAPQVEFPDQASGVRPLHEASCIGVKACVASTRGRVHLAEKHIVSNDRVRRESPDRLASVPHCPIGLGKIVGVNDDHEPLVRRRWWRRRDFDKNKPK